MTATEARAGADLSTCDRDPIHIPGSIQPHGTLLVLDESASRVRHAAANAGAILGRPIDSILGCGLGDLFGRDEARAWGPGLADPAIEKSPRNLGSARLGGGAWDVIAHRIDGLVILEMEPAEGEPDRHDAGPDPLLRAFLARLRGVASSADLVAMVAQEVRSYVGFDRVLVYRFDRDGHGTVIAEDRNDALPSYLGLRFPASDVPTQARELYKAHRVRLIADADYAPVPIVPREDPRTGRPTDLSFAALRSVAPVHLEYMRNMGTSASMSISILRGGDLWGLIACHNRRPKFVPFGARSACDVIGQTLSAYLEVKEHNEEFAAKVRLKTLEARLLQYMAEEEIFLDGLRRSEAETLEFVGAQGAAVVVEDQVTLMGRTPGRDQVRQLVEWLGDEAKSDLLVTDALASLWPPAAAMQDVAAGLIAIAVSRLHRSFVIWFRPEVARTVEWAGDPSKDGAAPGPSGRLEPRKSFATWKEVVRGRSLPWSSSVREAAADLRNAIVNIVLRRAEELAAVSDELRRSNKELEAFSYSVSHDLRAPLRHVVGYAQLLRDEIGARKTDEVDRFIDTIIDSARYAGTLVDNLLSFSQVGRTRIIPVPVDLGAMVEDLRRELIEDSPGRVLRWSIGPLPTVRGDLMMLRLLLRNLLSNAVKYTGTRPEAEIGVTCQEAAREYILCVSDNGVGFDMAYADKLFGVFQRLHRWEDFEGTGIGLANVRRIAERHGGRTWAEGRVGEGAKFYVSLPREAN